MADAPCDAGNRQQGANSLFIPWKKTDCIVLVSVKYFCYWNWRSFPVGWAYLNSALPHTVSPGVSNPSGRGDGRFGYGVSPPWRGKDWWGISAFTSRGAFLIPSGALTFAFTFTDDFLCYLVASTYVRIIRFRNHQLADGNMRSASRKTRMVN